MTTEPSPLIRLQSENVISLETYRKNGQPVQTPVWFLVENGIIYVHTDDRTGKAKRIKHNPNVRIAPSHFRGKPKADYVNGHAEIEKDSAIVKDYRARIYKKYGLQGRAATLLQRFSRSKAKDIIIRIKI